MYDVCGTYRTTVNRFYLLKFISKTPFIDIIKIIIFTAGIISKEKEMSTSINDFTQNNNDFFFLGPVILSLWHNFQVHNSIQRITVPTKHSTNITVNTPAI